MKPLRSIAILLLLILCAAMPPRALGANGQNSAEGENPAEILPPPAPELSECISFCAEVIEQTAAMKTNIAALPDLSEVETSLGDLETATKDLSEQISRPISDSDFTYNTIFQFRSRVTAQEKTFGDLLVPIQQTTGQLESWKKEWHDKKDRLSSCGTILSNFPAESGAGNSLAKAEKAADEALNLIARELERVLAVQQKGATIQARIGAMTANLDAMLSATKGQTLKKSAPSLLSNEYYGEFQKDLWQAFLRGATSVKWPGPQFWGLKGWMVMLQAVLALLITVSILRNRAFLAKVDRWRFLTRRPLSAGLFVSVWLVGPFYGIIDPTAAFVLWAVAGITAGRLIGGLTHDYRRRFGVYTLSALVIFIQLCRLIALPIPLFRLCVLFIALGGLILCAWQNGKIVRTGGARLYLWGMRMGGLVFLAVFALEVMGYHMFAAQTLESTLKTLLVLLLGWMFVVLLDGWVKFVLRTSLFDGIPRFRPNADAIAERLTRIMGLIVFAFLAVILLVVWRVYENVADAVRGVFSLGISIGSWDLTLGVIIVVAIALYVSFVFSWIVQGILLEKVFPMRRMQRGVQASMAKLVHYGIIFVGFLLALSFLGVDMKNITIIGGALGVGIGFGLQSIVSNFVSGLILLFERPIKAGDYVQLGDRWGEISRIGLRSTVVKTFDRSEVVVPNSDLISNEVTNWTLSDRSMRLKLPVGVAYGSDIEKVITTLKSCAEENPMVLSKPTPQVFFMNFGGSSLDFELRVWISDIDNMVTARSELNQEIDRTFRAAGIEIAFPQLDLHLRSVDGTAVLPLRRLSDRSDSTSDSEETAGSGDTETGEE